MKEKSFERKQELLEAALDVFSQKSYEDASLNSIIKKAGISKGTFYYHFGDKQELYIFLLESSSKAKWDFINNKIHEYKERNAEIDIFDMFKLQARIGVEFAITFPKYYKLTKMMLKEKNNEIFEVAINTLGRDSGEILVNMIDKAVEDGIFKEEFPRDFIVKSVSYMFSHFNEIFNEEDDFDLNRTLQNLELFVDFMKYGLKKQ
ncbi:TetR/AcrR family transcriptional regulator [Cytobacillus sp. IB215665]|uniref:TetR/AcrR family transcriptional regulator n=1 Tax=Cytobacillus sp. IB215665 TaxID=3097357 RepID=UPI002A176657|nr:TetR/AcrR family transcriptional regulator [Cytobacillus sp. IB215665]MDX8367945.1 TetR/AcrR family transcriptional regulator [Cytobacillus sp. IB215665]